MDIYLTCSHTKPHKNGECFTLSCKSWLYEFSQKKTCPIYSECLRTLINTTKVLPHLFLKWNTSLLLPSPSQPKPSVISLPKKSSSSSWQHLPGNPAIHWFTSWYKNESIKRHCMQQPERYFCSSLCCQTSHMTLNKQPTLLADRGHQSVRVSRYALL